MSSLHRLARLNHDEFLRELARWSGERGEVVERDGVLLYATGTEFPVTCNGVARLTPDVPDDVVLDTAATWFGDKSRGYTIQVEDAEGRDAGLVAAALERGALPLGSSPVMVRRSPLDAPAPDATAASIGVELRWVDDGAAAADFVSVSDRSYESLGMTAGAIEEMCVDRNRLFEPHLDIVVAYEGGEPLATALSLLSHGIGGVYYVGTLESARGRGLGELVTRAVTGRAFERGAAFVCLQATAMGDPIYRRMGYEQIGDHQNLVHFI